MAQPAAILSCGKQQHSGGSHARESGDILPLPPASARPTEFAMLAGRRRRRPDPHASHGRPEPCGGWGSGGREPAKDLRTTSDQREGGPCKFSGPFFYSHTPVISSPFITLQPHPRVGGHFRRAARCRRDGPAGLHRPACRPACQPRADPCKHASTSPNIPGRGRAGEGRQGRKGKFFPPHPPCRGGSGGGAASAS